ncbi:MAG: hypothetical protein ACRC0V_11015 [Fusobacteriaceae bacterium]
MKNISMVTVLAKLGKTTQVSQYLSKCLKENEDKEFYMVSVTEVEEFLTRQIISKLAYAEQSKEMQASKEYLGFTEKVSIKTTTKKGTAQKKGTIADLRKFLEMKGLTSEFLELLNQGGLEETEEN